MYWFGWLSRILDKGLRDDGLRAFGRLRPQSLDCGFPCGSTLARRESELLGFLVGDVFHRCIGLVVIRIPDKDLRDDDDYVFKELPKLDGIGLLPARTLAEEELSPVLVGDLNHVTYREGGCAILVVYFRQRFLIFAQQFLGGVGDMEDLFSYVCPRCLGWSDIQLECAGDAALDGPRVFLRGKTAPVCALE